MRISFFDTYPCRSLAPDVQSLLAKARRLDAAVAFITEPGFALLRQYVKARPPGTARLVASVRFPTNLTELAYCDEDYPGTVFLHTGFQTPVEEGAERGQFRHCSRHTPCAVTTAAHRVRPNDDGTRRVPTTLLDGRNRCIVLGSHNWTGNAPATPHPWQMTRGQYQAPCKAQGRTDLTTNNRAYWREIKTALQAGHPVPENVRNEYKQLKAKK